MITGYRLAKTGVFVLSNAMRPQSNFSNATSILLVAVAVAIYLSSSAHAGPSDWFVKASNWMSDGPSAYQHGFREAPRWVTEVHLSGEVRQHVYYFDGGEEVRSTVIAADRCEALQKQIRDAKLAQLEPPYPEVFDAPHAWLDILFAGRNKEIIVAGISGWRPVGATLSEGDGNTLRALHAIYYEIAGIIPAPTLSQLEERARALHLSPQVAYLPHVETVVLDHDLALTLNLLRGDFPDLTVRWLGDNRFELRGPDDETRRAASFARSWRNVKLSPTTTPPPSPGP